MKTTNRNASLGMGEATEVDLPVGRIAAGAAIVGVTFAAIDLAKGAIEQKMGKKSFPDFDIEVSMDKEKGIGRLKARDKKTVEEEKAAIRDAKKTVKEAKKALKDAKGKEEKKEARKDLRNAEKELERLLDPDNVDLDEDDDDEDDKEEAA